MKIKNILGHIKTICKHKFWVFYYCAKAGFIWRGIKHDMSKFSPTEFIESIKYYTGVSSPIDECKKVNGVSNAWMHHKGRNDHHYEYWVDNLDNGGKPLQMPFECAVEILCDFLGAGRAYSGNSFTYRGELKWFINRINSNIAMHSHTIKFIYLSLSFMSIPITKIINPTIENRYFLPIFKIDQDRVLKKSNLKIIYNYASNISDEKFEIIRKSVEEYIIILDKRGDHDE